MKELVQIWKRVTGTHYSVVNEKEENRSRKCNIDSSTFDANISECEELNEKFNQNANFDERKDAAIHGLFSRRRSNQMSKQSNRSFLLLLLGFLGLGIGLSIMVLHPYDVIFNWKLKFSDGGEIYEMWRKPDINLYTRVYLFNVTNAEEYMSGRHDKLKMVEVGPYVYRELLEHSNVTFNDNGTLSTVPHHPLVWDQEMSGDRTEEDVLFLPHIALLSIAHVTSQRNIFARIGLNNLIRLTDTQPLVKMTAREFMMGHKSELLTLGHSFMPGWIYFDKLGLIDRMYDFEGDYATIYTGETDVTRAGLVDTYRGSTDLPQWNGKHCSNVQNASDGTKFKGSIKKNETIYFYRKSLCRAAPLVQIDEGTKNGLRAYEYTFPKHLLDNGKYFEENKCFCREGKCLPEGLLDVTDCYYGFPIALSYPHFYQGDDILFEKVEGLKPSQADHETRIWINPESGTPLDLSAKIQINMALGDISTIENTKRFANMFLPLLWFDIRVYSLTPSIQRRCVLYITILPVVEKVFMYGGIIVGLALIIRAVYIATTKIVFKTNKQKISKVNFQTNIWIEKENQKTHRHKGDIYVPCEVALNSTDSDNSDQYDSKPTFIQIQTDRLREFSHKLSDRVHDSVGNVKDKFGGFTHNKHNHRKNSLINPEDSPDETNDAYRSDSGEDSDRDLQRYRAQNQKVDDCKYLEVIDDSSEFET